ncbi:hypothetical protein J2045_000948 [Peteryoungia aggregata LMG 23059]|uniref:Uncharacterized protein n=1 Tax=Peteryoungia aggregata LMG 23059 TaxID=1368425 RepID=A0ABU0G5H5_9HYPH|nr:hypothetical protein [Peteryoungia aggregata LMG 23059]
MKEAPAHSRFGHGEASSLGFDRENLDFFKRIVDTLSTR